jgi:outer membrane protein assembly factor BamB
MARLGALVLMLSQAAAAVELRLVPFDDPDQTVDKLVKERPILNPISTPQGVEMKQIGVDYTGWARNVLLDGNPVFERFYEGRYIDRLPVAKADLKPGDHTIWPGNHVFTVGKDGGLSTKSPGLRIEGDVVRILCYPVTLSAYVGNPPEDVPRTMRTTPLPNLTIRDATDAESEKPRELVPFDGKLGTNKLKKFAPLKLWLPANTTGDGYLVHPLGLRFHLDGGGVKPVEEIPGLPVKGHTVDIPVYEYPVSGEPGASIGVVGVGNVGWQRPGTEQLTLYPRKKPFELLVAKPGPSLEVTPTGFPIKALTAAVVDPIAGTQRLLVAELAARHVEPGGKLAARVRGIDSGRADVVNATTTRAKTGAESAAKELQAARAAVAAAEKALAATPNPDAQAAVDRAKAAVEPAAAKLKAAEAAATAAKTEAEKLALENPVENAPVFARIQRYGSDAWQDLAVTPAADHGVTLAIPEVPGDVYTLRVGLVNANQTGREVHVDQWIAISRPEPLGIGLFTPRGRDCFFRGESFWLGVGAIASQPLPAGAMLELDWVDEKGRRLPALREKIPAIEKRRSFLVRFDGQQTLSLAAGRYRLEARIGSRAAYPLDLEIVEPEPATHFTNLLNGKYNSLGAGRTPYSYRNVIKTGKKAEELAAEITARGCNAFMGMTYDISRIHRHGQELEQLVRDRPELGPWEHYYQPSGRDRFLNAAVRRNLDFYENMFTQNDSNLPREPTILAACERYVGLETASMRFSPAFKGVCLYDELYESGDHNTPGFMLDAFSKAEEMRYRERYPGMTSSDAVKAFDRFASRPAGQRKFEDLTKFRTWPAHVDEKWQLFSRRMNAAVKEVAPDSRTWTQLRVFGPVGSQVAGSGLPSDTFAPLDVATTVSYKDGGQGDRPVLAPMMADVLKIRDDIPVWTQIYGYSKGIYDHPLRQTFFALSQGIQGINYFQLDSDPAEPSTEDMREITRTIAGRLATPYGDFLAGLERGYRRVAVYYSRESDHLSLKKQNKVNITAEGIWVACMRAGFPADFLYDGQLLAGKGAAYDVIFAPGYAFEDEVSPAILETLKKLVAAGKTVVVERSSKLPIEGLVRLNSELDDYDDKLGGAFPQYIDHETRVVWKATDKMTKLIRDLLSKKIPPAAIHDRVVGPDWLKGGKGEYLFMPNFAPTGFTGSPLTLYQAPDIAPLRFPARPANVYDVLEMKPVQVAREGEWMTLAADMRHLPGKIYAFLPAAIAAVTLEASSRLDAGSNLNFRAGVAGADGTTIDAAFPLEVTITDPEGNVRLHVFRAARPVYETAWRVPVNAAAGGWTLRVRELISGAVAEAAVEVAAAQQPAVTGRLDDRTVWIDEPERVGRFGAEQPAADTPAIVIAIDAEQPWVRPHAEALVAALGAKGRKARIAPVSEVVRVVDDWSETPVIDGGRLWRGELVDPGLFVDAPLILLGRRYENRLLEALARRDVFPQVLSANFPGPGRAAIHWTRRGFSTRFDTVTIFADDDAGMAAGVAAMPNAAAGGAAPTSPRNLARAAFAADAKLVTGRPLPPAPSTLRDAASGEDWIQAIDVDPASGRILVGTMGYGDNLFCFSRDGKLLWKQFLPEYYVYFARWIDGGKRVAAATARGCQCFLLDGQTGSVFKKFDATEHPKFHRTEAPITTTLQIEVNEPLRQILIRGLTGLLAVDFDGNKMWFLDRAEAIAAYVKEAEQGGAARFGSSLHVGNVAFSPDGKRIAYSEESIIGSTILPPNKIVSLWAHAPRILDAKTGATLSINQEDPGNDYESGNWTVAWPKDARRPSVIFKGLAAELRDDNTLGPYVSYPGPPLPDGGRLVASPTALERFDADGKSLWRLAEDRIWVPELDSLNAEQSRWYRCDRDGLVRCIDPATGKTLWDFKMPFASRLAAFGDEVVAGATNGALAVIDAAGKATWQTRIRGHHELSGAPYPAYVQAAIARDRDSSAEFYAEGIDGPDDYRDVLRMGVEQLQSGGFESAEGWQSPQGPVTLGKPAKEGGAALQMNPAQLVTQRPTARVIPAATYLLEFWYRVEDPDARVIAGAVLQGAKQTFTGSRYRGRPGEWTFGRLAIKTAKDTRSLEVGFEAVGGKAAIDAASLRAIRFPSANLLANDELAAVEPTFVEDIRVQFERIPPPLKERLMTRNKVSGFVAAGTATAIIFTQEQAYLHNGRLDDVGNIWTNFPDPMGFSVTLMKPSYVSQLVLYLNNATPDKVYPRISVLANDLQTKTPREVALVRRNHRRFIVVHFPEPVLTDSLKILPGSYEGHTDSLTEIEVYGSLDGGGSKKLAPDDPDAMPMLMGTAAHVPATLPTDLEGKWIGPFERPAPQFPAFASGATVVDGVFTVSDPAGAVRSVKAVKPDPKTNPKPPPRLEPGPEWPLASITPTTTPCRYAGRLLVGSADHKLHAVADNGTYLWSFPTDGRVYSSPVPQADDVFFGSDDGRLYKVDVDSGILIWEFATGDKIRGAPALAAGKVVVASWDGFLYALDAESGRLAWKAPIAPFTRATPAIHQGRVYLGDEGGVVRALDLGSGRELWKQSLGGRISTCPLVTPAGIAWATDGGTSAGSNLALVGSDGTIRWTRPLGMGISGQPIATQTQLLVPTETGLLVLKQADGQPDPRFEFQSQVQGGPKLDQKVLSVAKWRDQLFLNVGYAWTDYRWPPRTYMEVENRVALWVPESPPPSPEAPR